MKNIVPSFKGVESRGSFWLNTVIMTVILVSVNIFLTIFSLKDLVAGAVLITVFNFFYALVWLGLVVRRLRDSGHSTMFVLLMFVPLFNFLAYVVFGCLPTQEQKA